MTIKAIAFTCLLAACSGSSSDPGAAPSGAPAPCGAGEIEVTSCGGGEKACVRHAPASNCDAFNRAQPTSDNPCNFGTRYSATCAQVTDGRVSCACF